MSTDRYHIPQTHIDDLYRLAHDVGRRLEQLGIEYFIDSGTLRRPESRSMNMGTRAGRPLGRRRSSLPRPRRSDRSRASSVRRPYSPPPASSAPWASTTTIRRPPPCSGTCSAPGPSSPPSRPSPTPLQHLAVRLSGATHADRSLFPRQARRPDPRGDLEQPPDHDPKRHRRLEHQARRQAQRHRHRLQRPREAHRQRRHPARPRRAHHRDDRPRPLFDDPRQRDPPRLDPGADQVLQRRRHQPRRHDREPRHRPGWW